MFETLNVLMEEIDALFEKKELPIGQHTFTLVRWNNGYWSVDVTNDWAKWNKKGFELPNEAYKTPEIACSRFLRFVKEHDVDVRSIRE